MRVALLAPIAWRTPPRHYGPWERVVALLAEGLVGLGVDVTLFATRDSHVEGAKLEAVVPAPYEEDPTVDAQVWIGLHVANCIRQAGRFDLVHSHLDFFPLAFSPFTGTPLLTTIHGFSSERILPAYRAFDATTHYVAISDADRHPDLHYAATVYHGIDLPQFTFREAPGGYLLFFGRFHPDKGPHAAIRVAREVGMPLVMAGVVQDRAYFEREVAPHLDGERVRYVGSVGPEERDRLLGGAYALLHLIGFDEPFGLSVVEAMACGTPTLATARGSMPELLTDGVTGLLLDPEGDPEAEAVARMDDVRRLDRQRLRAEAERRFSQRRMAEDYLRVYRAIAQGEAGPLDAVAA